ncbi:hypothetical protein TNIN_466361 [Trichonephila inaurata madagascariensis]|uniref:Uncharacterized protein n=1 Tax=Trichonephila inaurata madagascariensis TaxID=2747483 RepID=A0A8X6XDE5_9ARAC|nr:hypothetical protein TNIN_466361 [Trichonephila inaurata madagascariensis]
MDHPGLETSAIPANDNSRHKKKYLDHPGLETSAIPANDNSGHKKKYLDHPDLKRNATRRIKALSVKFFCGIQKS